VIGLKKQRRGSEAENEKRTKQQKEQERRELEQHKAEQMEIGRVQTQKLKLLPDTAGTIGKVHRELIFRHERVAFKATFRTILAH
jgi:G:T/U-mismatch repair DNA glycosylase